MARDYSQPDPMAAARFEAFAKMRLEGRADLIYRNYDLFKQSNNLSLNDWLRNAGQPPTMAGGGVVLRSLQHRFKQWGYDKDTGWISRLLREYYNYQLIRHKGKYRPRYRDDATVRRLYEEDKLARLQQARHHPSSNQLPSPSIPN
jgi:hypothetical protein